MSLSAHTSFFQKVEILIQSFRTGSKVEQAFWNKLKEDEHALIELMNDRELEPGKPGNIELGWCLYFLNHETDFILRELLHIEGMPESNIDEVDWLKWLVILNVQGVVTGNGSLVSTAKYAVLDIGWGEVFINQFLEHLDLIKKHDLIHTPKVTDLSELPSLKIGLFGDWGTGAYHDGTHLLSPSEKVMNQLSALNPDVLIHLGDVYYSGTKDQEQEKLLDRWIKAPHGNFTMNSNHEMYDGAQGLYKTALDDLLFTQQNGCTYFSITYNDWVILGMDSAYNATGFYMEGAITDQQQRDFIKTQSEGKKSILLTHHNPIDFQGIGQEANCSLWNDVVNESMGGNQPNVWYWGHVHNGVVYNEQAYPGKTLARCLGHGAIPFGDANWLHNQPQVEYYANTPMNDGVPKNELRNKNGFAILELSGNQLTETWYDQDGAVAWTKTSVF